MANQQTILSSETSSASVDASDAKIFVVAAGSYEQEDGLLIRTTDYISEPQTLAEALADFATCRTHVWARIECGDYEITAKELEQ